jgi:hypothetical protein
MKEPDDPGAGRFPLGMSAADAQEYIFHQVTTLKLTEKAREEVAAAYQKWQARGELARKTASGGQSAGDQDAAGLAEVAEQEAARWRERRDSLDAEIIELTERVASLKRQLPGVAARERSVDPDLLEQELRLTRGEDPGSGPSPASVERRFEAMNANAALNELKLKMGLNPGQPTDGGDASGTGETP